jgi:hypothetical protein
MSVTPVSKIGDNTLGNYLKVVSQNGVYSQLSEQSTMWSNILKRKKGAAEGRELRFLLRSSYGMAAAQFVAVNGAVEYPAAQQATLSECTAYYKDFALTVEVERTLIAKALSDMSRYGEPLAEELKCKTIGMARMLSAAVYQDGTGVIGTVLSTSVSGGQLIVTLNTGDTARGHVGWGEYGDKVKLYSTAGAAHAVTVSSGTISYYTIGAIDRVNDKWYINAYDASNTQLSISAANTVTAGDLIYRSGITPNDTTAISTTAEYGTLSEAFVGLDAITQDDGRKVFGVNLNAPIKGTRFDCGANPVDSQHFQQLMSLVKVAVGEGAYKWSNAIMAPEVLDALVESRETDRRFMSVKDNTRGVDGLGYQHGKDRILFETDEYCPKKRVYVVPQGDCLQFRGSDFEFVRPDGGQKFFLRPSTTGGHYRSVRAYLEGSGLIFSVHPQAIGVLHNYVY